MTAQSMLGDEASLAVAIAWRLPCGCPATQMQHAFDTTPTPENASLMMDDLLRHQMKLVREHVCEKVG
jgi:hypothetical protein